jgi:site-specific recombinase XerD
MIQRGCPQDRTDQACRLSHLPALLCHTATHLLADGYDIHTVQELLGHKDVKTTCYTPIVLNRGPRGVRSPTDGL